MEQTFIANTMYVYAIVSVHKKREKQSPTNKTSSHTKRKRHTHKKSRKKQRKIRIQIHQTLPKQKRTNQTPSHHNSKHDQKTNKMHPNNNYYKLYQTNPTLQNLTIQDYGYTYLIQKISQTTQLQNILNQTHNKHAQDIITTATYMIKENTNTTDTIDD
jgi:hypothetical protein